jgi:two-component system, sensor histidine kinase
MTMKLLIVDDNPQMRQMIRPVMSDLGAAVTECRDGDEALAAYAAQQFSRADRVLMDLQLPRVGGLEATRRIRAAFPDAQIIIIITHKNRIQLETSEKAPRWAHE